MSAQAKRRVEPLPILSPGQAPPHQPRALADIRKSNLVAITEESVIKSFQNGLSKGFLSGLETIIAWHENNPKAKLPELVMFVKACKEAQLENKN